MLSGGGDYRNASDYLQHGDTPFSYRVAKTLDPNVYRNIEYDTWHADRRGKWNAVTAH